LHSRYRPPERPPSSKFLQKYLSDARVTISQRLAEPEAAEARRVEAVAALLALGRSALAHADEWGNMTDGRVPVTGLRLSAMPVQLQHFLRIEGLRILTADNPVAALQRFLGHRKRGRGRPRAVDIAFRDRMIAADIQELVDKGSTIDGACQAVGETAGLSPEAARNIYVARRDTPEVRAELGFRELFGDAKSKIE
jgi:hypothetical protein